ncbi:hypothetical protein KY317_02035 [Candidatus Woesearchaeota archaeon]|nr:hypothetical protein [Candidatus Woesearchaeota archaeon]
MSEETEKKCCNESLEFKVQDIEPWKSYRPEIALCWICFSYYERKIGSKIIYKKTDDGFLCTNCGEGISFGKVAHPIHDGPFPMSGSGKCEYESVPYCPNCEEEPDFHGTPIRIKPEF